MSLQYYCLNLTKDFTWDSLTDLGIKSKYYEVDRWLIAEGIDSAVLQLFHRKRDEFLSMWRCLLLQDINEWNNDQTINIISDSLSLRCFCRLNSLTASVPTEYVLTDFLKTNLDAMTNALKYAAATWLSETTKITIFGLTKWARKALNNPFIIQKYQSKIKIK